ncbi:MAG: hypothetical protein CL597_02820 [Alteromonas sp.]|nr:hypothetical protein [Alteromonas sp.]
MRLVQIKRAAHEGRKVVTKNIKWPQREKGEQMKKNRFMKKGIKLKNNNRRRLMLKRCHQKVLQRRKLFVTSDMFTQLTRTPS